MVCSVCVEAFGNYKVTDSLENTCLSRRTFGEVIDIVLKDFSRRIPCRETDETVKRIRHEIGDSIYLQLGRNRYNKYLQVRRQDPISAYLPQQGNLEIAIIVQG